MIDGGKVISEYILMQIKTEIYPNYSPLTVSGLLSMCPRWCVLSRNDNHTRLPITPSIAFQKSRYKGMKRLKKGPIFSQNQTSSNGNKGR